MIYSLTNGYNLTGSLANELKSRNSSSVIPLMN